MFRDLVVQMRPRHWSKNILLFAGLIFAQGAGRPVMWLQALLGFAAFSCVSSAVYVLNDWMDRERDRAHPEKRHRPIASGRLGAVPAFALLAVLLAVGGALSVRLGTGFVASALAYLVLQFFYSAGLKRVLIVDVLCLASGFVIRAIAGVELLRSLDPSIGLSPWLEVCTFFGALFLGGIKRRQEMELVEEGSRRAVLHEYSLPLLDDMILIAAACTLFSYALYTIAPATVDKFHTNGLVFTIPFVVFGLFRYLYLTRVHRQGENPTEVLLHDRPILVDGALWAALVAVILYGPWPRQL